MPYKDLEARRECHRRSDKRRKPILRIKRLKDALRQGKYNWSTKGRAARKRYNTSLKGRANLLAAKARYRARKRLQKLSREQELTLLIAEQARDDKTYQIKYDPGLWAKEDTVYESS
jgi:hypothetical protein